MPKRTRFRPVLVWLLLLCFYSPYCFAPDPDGFLKFDLPEDPQTKQHGFLVPNELFPQDGLEVFRAAGPGAYISVGTERGFIHFALSTRATHLILVDTDPDVARFNRINRTLLAASTSRADYVRLRTATDFDMWKAAAGRNGGKVNLAGLGVEEEFKFWQESRRSKAIGDVAMARDRFAALERPTGSSISREYFRRGNYLYDDALYARMSRAAKEGRIQVENFSLRSIANFEAMAAKLKEQGIALSVFDMSNAWWQTFMPLGSTKALLKIGAEHGGPNGLFLATDRLKGGLENYVKQLPELAYRGRKSWVYLGFTFGVIEKLGGPEAFLEFMFEDTMRPSRKVVLNGVTWEPYQTRASCVRMLGKTAVAPITPPPGP